MLFKVNVPPWLLRTYWLVIVNRGHSFSGVTSDKLPRSSGLSLMLRQGTLNPVAHRKGRHECGMETWEKLQQEREEEEGHINI